MSDTTDPVAHIQAYLDAWEATDYLREMDEITGQIGDVPGLTVPGLRAVLAELKQLRRLSERADARVEAARQREDTWRDAMLRDRVELEQQRDRADKTLAIIVRVTRRMDEYELHGSRMVNVRQVLNLLSPTWPDGNYSSEQPEPAVAKFARDMERLEKNDPAGAQWLKNILAERTELDARDGQGCKTTMNCLCPHNQTPDGTLIRYRDVAVGCPVHDVAEEDRRG